MTKSKSLALPIVVPSIFVLQLMNGAQFLNTTWAEIFLAIVILHFTKMQVHWNH